MTYSQPDSSGASQGHAFSLRERLTKYGADTLENNELLELLLSPSRQRSGKVRDAISEMRFSFLCIATADQLVQHFDLTAREAHLLKVVITLAKRISSPLWKPRIRVNSPKKVACLLMPEMRYLDREHLRVLCLGSQHQLMANELVAIGTVDSTLSHPREVFKPAVIHSAVAIIVIHNHPSGDPQPSTEDIHLTQQLMAASKILGIELIDHVILGDGDYVSLKDRGCLVT